MRDFLCGLVFILPLSAFGGARYDLKINAAGYDLKIQMTFSAKVSLSQVAAAFKNPLLLPLLGTKVKSVSVSPLFSERYDSLMRVKSWGVESELLSHCQESTGTEGEMKKWKRSCRLDTEIFDGGRFMEQKSDEVLCQEREEGVMCDFLILGKTKPLVFLGIPLLSAEAFAMKAKYEALLQHFKIYFYLRGSGLSPVWALRDFEASDLKKEVEATQDEGLKILKTSSAYEHSSPWTEGL